MTKECDMPTGDGELRGDTKPMPDRGTGTNVSDTYGADIGLNSTNRIGGISGATKSDPAAQDMPHGKTWQ